MSFHKYDIPLIHFMLDLTHCQFSISIILLLFYDKGFISKSKNDLFLINIYLT